MNLQDVLASDKTPTLKSRLSQAITAGHAVDVWYEQAKHSSEMENFNLCPKWIASFTFAGPLTLDVAALRNDSVGQVLTGGDYYPILDGFRFAMSSKGRELLWVLEPRTQAYVGNFGFEGSPLMIKNMLGRLVRHGRFLLSKGIEVFDLLFWAENLNGHALCLFDQTWERSPVENVLARAACDRDSFPNFCAKITRGFGLDIQEDVLADTLRDWQRGSGMVLGG